MYLFALCLASCLVPSDEPTVFQATGFKVGEVTAHEAIVWTRLTRNAQANPADAPMVEIVNADEGEGSGRRAKRAVFPDGVTVDDIRHAAPGAEGQVRVGYRRQGDDDWTYSDWTDVDPDQDFTAQIRLTELTADQAYDVKVETRDRDGSNGLTLDGGFHTAATEDSPQRVVFTVSTGQAFRDQDDPDGFKLYRAIRAMDPSFFVHTGDILYYDTLAKTYPLALYHWQRTYSRPTNIEFHRHVASYFIKDDHDTWMNDCWPTQRSRFMGEFTFAQGVEIFKFQVPMGERTYRTVRWGKDLQIWMVEGRDFRSANPMEDGPEKTIWGAEQKAWFKRTVAESDATFRVLISPTPVVGPDRNGKNDNHSNRGFTHEGDELRAFIASQKNMFVVCGDRHWQYHSVHPESGVREYSCGPASDKHAGGWRQNDFREEYHKYLNVIGGYLSVTVDREGDKPFIEFQFHDVDGEVKYGDRIEAE